VLVGFAAETDNVLLKAREKRARKNADLIVANDVSQEGVGFDGDTNAVTIIGEDGEQPVALRSKAEVAAVILDRIEKLLARRAASMPARA
jgi:phosphopantothenoylcysteine decarboxylase / phosphopantothenate---cysteine ligase